MKYQSLVSSTTPSDLQEWLGQELEDRGIDSVYARSVLSLLQQDCVDIEPKECQHFQNRQLKVLHKYGGPENLFSATKSKHQKWKTWGKQMLLNSSSCCKTVISDLEILKKQTAVECLRTASDYVNHIEELIEEVWIKLKNIKTLKVEEEDIILRNVKDTNVDSFFIPPSSPTDEIKKYFAAFPSLNEQLDKETDVHQLNIKNAWCGVCVTKKTPKLHTSNKCNQPIIPYSPLKQIKAIYQSVESTILLDHDEEISHSAHLKTNEKNCINTTFGNRKINWPEQIELTKQVLCSVKSSWKEIYSLITKPITVFFEHLFFIQINLNFLLEESNFISEYGLKICIEESEPNFFIKTLFKSNFLISNFDKSLNRNGTEDIFSNLINFQKEIFDNYFDCVDFKDSEMSVHITESKSSDSNHDQSSFQPNTNEMNISLVQNSSNSLEQSKSTYLECLSFEGNFKTNNKYHHNLLPSNSLVASNENEILYPAYVVSDSHSAMESFKSENSAFDLVKDSNYLYNENLSIEGKDGLKRTDITGGQQLLKEVLFFDKIYMVPQSEAPPSCTSFEQRTFPLSNEALSQAVVSSNENISYVQHCNNTVQESRTADWPQKSIQFNEMWFLFWGVEHNHISLTWQKDFIPFGSIQNLKLPNVSEYFLALSNEITEDGVQLLNVIDFILSNGEDPIMYYNMVAISNQNNFPTDSNYNSQANSDKDPMVSRQIVGSQQFTDLNDGTICSPVNDVSFTSISIESDSPTILHTQVYQNSLFNFENSYMEATDNIDLSALPNSFESVNPIENDYYIEGGGWSYEECFLDYADLHERPGSLDDLELKNSEYSEFAYTKRIRCTSETDDIKQLIRKQNENQIQKRRFRQKFPIRNRPCLFFLQGNCSRPDCKYSHDLSTTTCRFWKEGSCFKGDTCPFLHGYVKENTNEISKLDQFMRKSEGKHDSYSLESESDFPSLSSPKPEHSKSDPALINTLHVKREKK